MLLIICSVLKTYSTSYNFEMTPKLLESDHRPLEFWFKLPLVREMNNRNSRVGDKLKNTTFKYVYDRNKLNEYMANYDNEYAQQTLFQIGCVIENNVNTDILIDTIFKYVTDSIEPTFYIYKYIYIYICLLIHFHLK